MVHLDCVCPWRFSKPGIKLLINIQSRREVGYVGKRTMEMAVPGIRKRERPRRRWIDLAREDLKSIGAKEGDEVDRVKWRILSRRGEPE